MCRFTFEYIKSENFTRVPVKLLALYSMFAIIVFLYWLLPEYAGDFYKPFWAFFHRQYPG